MVMSSACLHSVTRELVRWSAAAPLFQMHLLLFLPVLWMKTWWLPTPTALRCCLMHAMTAQYILLRGWIATHTDPPCAHVVDHLTPFSHPVLLRPVDCEVGVPVAPNQLYCDQCFCYICDKPASSVSVH